MRPALGCRAIPLGLCGTFRLSSSSGRKQQQQEGGGGGGGGSGSGGKAGDGFFSLLKHGPRSRAEFLGLCLGCGVFPLSVMLLNWYDEQKHREHEAPQLAPEFQSMKNVTLTSRQQLGGPFRLRESRTGAYITDKEIFRDHWTLLYFGFSKCAEVCPTTLQFISELMRKCDATMKGKAAEEASRLQTVFLSIDSFRDTPEVLEAFVSKYDPRVRALCGNREEVLAAAQAWRVFYSSIEETQEEREAREAKGIDEIVLDDTYQFDHSSAIYLVGPDGKMKDFFFKEMGMEDALSRLGIHFDDVYGFGDTR